MKKIILLSILFSASSFASDNHFYTGASLLVSDNTKLKSDDGSIDESNDLGFNAFGGYSFSVSPNIDLGVELEYQHFGEAEFVDDVSVEGDAFFINARPKFIESRNNLYSALILGVGSLEGKTNIYGESESESEIAYQAGIEIGYMLDQIDIGVGYRYRYAKFDDVDFSIQGITAGVRYNFWYLPLP